jgi:RNA polymerase sigma-70 factor (ECF subfamily)
VSDPIPSQNIEPSPGAQFTTTHWSVVLAAADTAAPGGDEALEKLCHTYWLPIYAYIRRQGRSPDDARDLTQEFFAQFLERKRIKLADPTRGRFRSFLISSLKNFLTGEWRRAQAEKRGGGQWIVSLEQQQEAETRLNAEPADPATTPDHAFEKRWALTLLDQVLSRLRQQFTAQGRREQFDALKVFVWGDAGTDSQADVAARLGITVNALGVTVHRLRRQFGELLREEITQTVATAADVDDELRHLMGVLSS